MLLTGLVPGMEGENFLLPQLPQPSALPVSGGQRRQRNCTWNLIAQDGPRLVRIG